MMTSFYNGPESIEVVDDDNLSVTIGSPVQTSSCAAIKPEQISVIANTPRVNTFNATKEVLTFDVVFDVTIQKDDGCYECYQVVKRIGIDKCKLAAEALCSDPVNIVESKSTAADLKNQVRRLAGLL